MKTEAIYIKLGGSFITYKDKPFSVNYEALEYVAKALRKIIGVGNIILGHGGGSFAHPTVKLMEKHGDPIRTVIHCQRSTRTLNKIIVDYLLDQGIPVIQAQTSMIICRDGDKYRVNVEPVYIALKHGIIPVVYGECILDSNGVYRVLSTERVFMILAEHIKPIRVVFVERVKGVYDKDPDKHPDAKLIRVIDRNNYEEVLETLSSPSLIDVTGGIIEKVRIALEIAKRFGVECLIVSGFEPENFVNAVLGREFEGTIIRW